MEMTLREKFNEKLPRGFASDCEKIANEFAIEFAEWLLSRSIGETIQLKDDTLEKFKKEKGL